MVDRGHVGGVPLGGLAFTVAVAWPGAIHEGGGRALVLVDAEAGEAQRGAIELLASRELGGPWGVLASTWTVVDGPRAARYQISSAGHRSRVRASDALELELEPITNPATGAEVHPGVVLPEGIVVKEGSLTSSKRFTIGGALAFDHSGKYAGFGPFAYSGP
jgi:hypothetical protein